MLIPILLVASLSFLLKVVPQWLPVPINPASVISKGLDLTVCAMTGQIIMDAAVGGKSLSALIAGFGVYDLAALLAAAASYLTCFLSGSLVKGLAAGLAFFLITTGVFL